MSAGWKSLIEPTLAELERRQDPSYETSARDHEGRLDPHQPLDPGDWAWLKANVRFDAGDLATMAREDILALFPATRRGKNPPLNDPALLQTFVWQTWLKVRSGELGSLDGNVRSLWYQHVEDLYQRNQLLPLDSRGVERDEAKEIIIEIMTDQVQEFVWHRIFRYRDELNLNRTSDGIYQVGSRGRPGILFHTEKEGLYKHCEQLHDGDPDNENRLLAGESISVMASRGQPSYLALEYFAKELKARQVSRLRIGCLCDYDPWGLCIGIAMDAKLRRLGFNVTTWPLTTDSLFTETDARSGKNYTELLRSEPDSPKLRSLQKMIGTWFKLTRGIRGKPICLHVDKADKDTRKERLKKFFTHLIHHDGAPPEYSPIRPGQYEQYQHQVETFLKRFKAEQLVEAAAGAETESEPYYATCSTHSLRTPVRASTYDTYEELVDVPQGVGELLDEAYGSYR
jgi:hypothetical protein